MNATNSKKFNHTKCKYKVSQYKKIKIIYLFFILSILTTNPVFSQRFGFSDDFENGSLELTFRNNQGNRPPFIIWGTDTPVSYQLDEEDGVLKIKYSRIEGTGAFDHFTYNSFRARNVNQNPRIQIQVKSDIETKLTASPVYSQEPPTYEYLEKEIPGDNEWHTYTFELTRAYYSNNNVQAIDFYFDRGNAEAKSGNIEMDNFRTAWNLINITDIEAKVEDGKNIKLTWKTSNQERTGGYKIYRSNTHYFDINENNLLIETETTEFIDKDLEPYKHYFYKIIAVSVEGEDFYASNEVHGETYTLGKSPLVKVAGINTSSVKKYEKFELILDLENVGIENPYDPEDIDVYAYFTAPSGKKIKIIGFYDNNLDADKWKIRFSPNETGEYKYQVFVNDAGGSGESAISNFTARESEHHGWIKPSEINPHYFAHDDGTSYYGVGVYSPWGNNQQRFDNFAEHKANLFAIWDITYGGFVNSTGLIEEELGRYNQVKLGRIDSLLTILEKDDIQLMYAIWPHDLFSETVWAAEWRNNPYSQLIDVDDVYSDSLVWEYQKKKYRYLIARFAHSRSMGIWELINEMNGTDGWAHGRHQECFDWVEKCDKYFEENDPYNHPVTASFSGGFTEYREELYKRNDIPNLHMYPAQGWEMKYPQDTMRSAMHNYAWASKRFWDAFEKPAIFGESGAGLAYYSTRDNDYHISYHNQIWASLASGLAATPVWWDYPVLTAEDWDQLMYLSDFVADIDFANLPYKPLKVSANGSDLYVIGTENDAFGWVRSYEKEDISGSNLNIQGLTDNTYKVSWYDTWSGNEIKTIKVKSQNGSMILEVPKMLEAHPDIAFKIRK
ncbi:MAG: DUF5060 domain-containing protein [Mariniphaga sp.]|nr:DUF5060 domain-containing protein [Mariniphaga sp.]